MDEYSPTDQTSSYSSDSGDVAQSYNYYFLTMLRDPIARFISEFKHVQRGATWKSSRHWCNGSLPTPHELPSCYGTRSNWANVTLDQFIECKHNLAFNRQTRMLSQLDLAGCYSQTNGSPVDKRHRDAIMLFSAKQNLQQMPFFGLCEEQVVSQYLFERTFNLTFIRPFVQFNMTRSKPTLVHLTQAQLDKIREINALDIELYAFAKQLLRNRFVVVKNRDSHFEEYFGNLLRSSSSAKQPNMEKVSYDKIVHTKGKLVSQRSASTMRKQPIHSSDHHLNFGQTAQSQQSSPGDSFRVENYIDSVEDYY